MQKFSTLRSIPAYLPIVNIDTDMIIPKQFLKTIKRTGLGKNLFFEMRYDDQGKEIGDFILNQNPFNNSKILIAGKNFGCGSSREHAPWALLDFGITCVISSSFADIFYSNCFKNGILPIKLDQQNVDILMNEAENKNDVSVDLENQKIIYQNDKTNLDFLTDSYKNNFNFEIGINQDIFPNNSGERRFSPMDRSLRRELKSIFGNNKSTPGNFSSAKERPKSILIHFPSHP